MEVLKKQNNNKKNQPTNGFAFNYFSRIQHKQKNKYSKC